jgi:hypothetical protein
MAAGSRQGVQDKRITDLAIYFRTELVSELLEANLIVLLMNKLVCALCGAFINDICCSIGKLAFPGEKVQAP